METKQAGTAALTVPQAAPTPEQLANFARVSPSGGVEYYTWYDLVLLFHAGALCKGISYIGDVTQNPSEEVLAGRRKAIDEEVNVELFPLLDQIISLGGAASLEQKATLADHIGDSIYVLLGLAANFGLPMDNVFACIHAFNMKKIICDGGPTFDENGKVVKPEGWKPPDQDIWNICQSLYSAIMKARPSAQINLPPEISDGSTGAPDPTTLAKNLAIPDSGAPTG